MEEKKVLLSVKDLEVEFRVRGRILTAIRGISLDIYENESIAIVGESAAGKSVFTKTFAGMLDDNGYVSNGSIVFNDPELAETTVPNTPEVKARIKSIHAKLNAASRYENGAAIYRRINELKQDRIRRSSLSEAEAEQLDTRIEDLRFRRAETYNLKLTIDPSKEKDRLKELSHSIKKMDEELKQLEDERKKTIAAHKQAMNNDAAYNTQFKTEMAQLTGSVQRACAQPVSADKIARNEIIAKEIYLSVGRYNVAKRIKAINDLVKVVRNAMKNGLDLDDDATRTDVFDDVAFRVRFLDENEERIHGTCVINLAKLKYAKDWTRIRGRRIATVFQDPMVADEDLRLAGKRNCDNNTLTHTAGVLEGIIVVTVFSIGDADLTHHLDCTRTCFNLGAVLMLHNDGGNLLADGDDRVERCHRILENGCDSSAADTGPVLSSSTPAVCVSVLLSQLRFPASRRSSSATSPPLRLTLPFRHRFSSSSKICRRNSITRSFSSRMTSVLLQMLPTALQFFMQDRLLKSARPKRSSMTRVIRTHGHCSALPAAAQRDTELFSITGTPPSLYNKIAGDPFAPRNPYCLKIDVVKAPPMFKITETHYAKTWLLDPRAPKIDKPAAIDNIHDKMIKAFNI